MNMKVELEKVSVSIIITSPLRRHPVLVLELLCEDFCPSTYEKA